MSAYYNDNDSFCCDWLSNLMDDGLITPGRIDNRSIADVVPADLLGYERVHLFAGIGIWDLALNEAGWRGRVWTASCPCPPFSSAGKDFRCPECDTPRPVPNAVQTGAFNCIWCDHEWQADGRHLWPEVHRLARDAKPELVLGEQVASKDGRTWIDVVRASLEMLGYAVGHPDVPACSFGAPHIRQRLYWMADAAGIRREPCPRLARVCDADNGAGATAEQHSPSRSLGSLADADDTRLEGRLGMPERAGERAARPGSVVRGLADPDGRDSGAERLQRSGEQRQQPQDGGAGGVGNASGAGAGRDAGTACGAQEGVSGARSADGRRGDTSVAAIANGRPGPLNGLWRDADWLCCTDGKWRPVAPGTFPLAPAGTVCNRVGTLRGAGNAINLAQAQGFIEAVMDIRQPMARAA